MNKIIILASDKIVRTSCFDFVATFMHYLIREQTKLKAY